MSQLALLGLIFIGLFVFTLVLLYVLVVIPASRRGVRRRLEAISGLAAEEGIESDLTGSRSEIGLRQANRFIAGFSLGRKLQLLVIQAGSLRSPAHFLLLTVGLVLVAATVALLINLPSSLALLLVCFAGIGPVSVLLFRRYRRFLKFEQQFPDALDVLARAVRAGYAFTTGLELIADEMPDPLAREFRLTFEQQNLGMPLRDALLNLSMRMPLSDVRIFVSTLQIQNETGGNLAEVLDNLSRVVRERFRLLRQVRVFTAEGRLSLYILTAMPPFMVLVMYLLNPKYLLPLFTDPLGQRMLTAAAVLQVVGYLVIRKIVNIKV